MGVPEDHQQALQSIGRAIRKHRKAKGLSQEALAELAGKHRNYFGRVERGEHNPKTTTLIDVARALGVSLADLVEGVR